jgi:hypothetical protein
MHYQDFLDRLQKHASLESPDEAARLTAATLETLGERLSKTQGRSWRRSCLLSCRIFCSGAPASTGSRWRNSITESGHAQTWGITMRAERPGR